MDIKGINQRFISNAYQSNVKRVADNKEKKDSVDRIEISSVGKSLHNYSEGLKEMDNSKKVEEIRNSISAGTYKIDGKLTAQSILDYIKEIKK